MVFRHVKTEIQRCLCSPYFYLSLIVCLGIYGVGEGYIGWVNIIKSPNATWVHEHNGFMMEFNPFRSLLPFPAVLASGGLLIEDWEHRNSYFQTTRCSFNRICNVKFFVSCFNGGLILAIGILCYLGLMACYVPAFDDGTYYEPFIEPILFNHQYGLYFLYFASLQFFLGALCAGMGCIVAILTDKRGMVYLLPMLIFAMLEIVTNITIVGLSGAQSAIVFRLEKQTPGHVYCVIAGILLGMTAVCYVLFRVLLRKRVYQWQ